MSPPQRDFDYAPFDSAIFFPSCCSCPCRRRRRLGVGRRGRGRRRAARGSCEAKILSPSSGGCKFSARQSRA